MTVSDLPEKYRAEAYRQLGQGKPLGTARAAAVAAFPVEVVPTPSPRRKTYEAKTNRKLHRSEPERDEATTLVSSTPREDGGIPRVTVRFTGYRVRPLDPDNFAGGCKDLLDGCRHAGLILGDEAWRISLQTEQIKVGTYAEEHTEIEIDIT